MAKDVISFTIDQTKFDHRATIAPMRKRLFPFLLTAKRLLIVFAIFGYLGAIFLNRKYETGAYNWIAFSAIGALILYYILLRVQVRKGWRSIANTPIRLGEQSVTLDAEKMSMRHPGCYTEIYWTHVVDVIDGRDGLLVLIGDLESYPIPKNAIPPDMTQAELKRQIADWIKHART